MLDSPISRGVALALCLFVLVRLGFSQALTPPLFVFVLTDGSQLTGAISKQSSDHIELLLESAQPYLDPAVSVMLDARNIASCSMVDLGVPSVIIFGHTCAAALPDIHSGLQQASLSLGYTGSAQRDESVKATATASGYEKLHATTGSFRGQTSFYLVASYDDKWKATPLSSNITQDYEGLLTQNIFTHRTPNSNCTSDDVPMAYQITGHAYHNNSQGIRVDQSYGFGLSKFFVFGKSTGRISPNCAKATSPYSQKLELSADVRSVNYILYAPGTEAHGVGTQFQVGYSRMFPSKQVLAFTIGGVPVYNRTTMSQASGVFYYVIPIKSSWAVQFSVTDNYYEIAPKTFNKNYVNIALGIKFSPPKTASPK